MWVSEETKKDFRFHAVGYVLPVADKYLSALSELIKKDAQDVEKLLNTRFFADHNIENL